MSDAFSRSPAPALDALIEHVKSPELFALEAILLGDDAEAQDLVNEMTPGERSMLRAACLRLAAIASGSPSFFASMPKSAEPIQRPLKV